MDRKLFKAQFQVDNLPGWVCPTCATGNLTLQMDKFLNQERRRSRDHSHEAWEPEWIEYIYAGLFICSNPSCLEVVSCVGKGSVDWDIEEIDGLAEQVYADYFRPLFFYPNLKGFSISKKVPEKVTVWFETSFSLIFADPEAALNQVRKGIEEVLTDFGIKRFDRAAGKLRPVTLHQRIHLLPPKLSEFKEMMLAVKWLGNAGSHAGLEVTIDDVLDSYELCDHLLAELYDKKTAALKKLASGVNKKKGPVKKP